MQVTLFLHFILTLYTPYNLPSSQRLCLKIKNAKNVLKKTNDKKKTALNSGIQKLKQQNARQDLLLYGKEFKGNMA